MKLNVSIKFKNGYDAITKADTRAKNENKDCVVRAFMNAFDVSYNDADSYVLSNHVLNSLDVIGYDVYGTVELDFGAG